LHRVWAALMRNNDDDAVELLGAAQLAVLSATCANARAVKANLGTALRRASAGAPAKIVRLSDGALAESEFLCDMAWSAETVDPAVFEAQRQRFAAAMGRLIYEVGVTRIRPTVQMSERPAPNVRVSSFPRFALVKARLASTLAELARKTRRVAKGSTLRQPRPIARRQDTTRKGWHWPS